MTKDSATETDHAVILREKIEKAKKTSSTSESLVLTVTSNELNSVLERLEDAELFIKVQPCKYTHEEPYDFDYCESHDRTFNRGGECDHKGLSIIDYIDDNALKQRGRAVIAEEYLSDALMLIDLIKKELKTADDNSTPPVAQTVLENISAHIEQYDYYVNYC